MKVFCARNIIVSLDGDLYKNRNVEWIRNHLHEFFLSSLLNE